MKYEVIQNGEVFVFITQKELNNLKKQILSELKISFERMKNPDEMHEVLKTYYKVSETIYGLEEGLSIYSLTSNEYVPNIAVFYFLEKSWKDIVKEVRKFWKGHIGVKCKMENQ